MSSNKLNVEIDHPEKSESVEPISSVPEEKPVVENTQRDTEACSDGNQQYLTCDKSDGTKGDEFDQAPLGDDDSFKTSINELSPISQSEIEQRKERAKKKSWYSVIYPSYKSRSESFKKLFKDVPQTERLIVDYSCALQREILAHGRMYVTQNYLCFHANIFGWESYVSLQWKDITAVTKEKTALVIPNAILFSTETEKFIMRSFAARDKAYLVLFRMWQNALMNKSMSTQEIWQFVHREYGEQLGLTSDDEEDYVSTNYSEKMSDNECDFLSDDKNVDKLIATTTIMMATANSLTPPTTTTTNDSSVGSRTSADEICSVANTSTRLIQSKIRMRNKSDLIASNDNLPTDLSNSTDSEDENSVPFVSTAECTAMHEGRQLVHAILPINVDNLMALLFEKSKFFADFHNMRKTTNMVYGDWVTGDDGIKRRTMNFTVAVTQPIGPKTSNMTEMQVMRECTVPGELYSIDVTSTNAGIPYADSFHVLLHYCLVRTVDDHTMLSVYAQIKYTKSVWGVVKGFIEKNIWYGMEDFYKSLLLLLQKEYNIPPAKSKSRRTKRVLSQKASNDDPTIKSRPATKSTTKSSSAAPVIASSTNQLQENCNQAAQRIFSSTLIKPRSQNAKPNRLFSINLDRLTILIVILVICLIVLNIILVIKLFTLQNQINNSRMSATKTFTDATSSHNNHVTISGNMREKWMNIVQEQKAIHDNELAKWQQFIKLTADLLKKVKIIYSELVSDKTDKNDEL